MPGELSYKLDLLLATEQAILHGLYIEDLTRVVIS